MMDEKQARFLDELLSILGDNLEVDEFDLIIVILDKVGIFNVGIFNGNILDELLNILGDNLEEDEFDRIIDILDNAGVFKEDDNE